MTEYEGQAKIYFLIYRRGVIKCLFHRVAMRLDKIDQFFRNPLHAEGMVTFIELKGLEK